MASILENAPQRLVLKSGSVAVAFDKAAGTATLQRKLLFFPLKPVEVPLSEVAGAETASQVDPASRAEFYNTMVKLRSGSGWVLAADSKSDAEAAAGTIRSFLGLGSA